MFFIPVQYILFKNVLIFWASGEPQRPNHGAVLAQVANLETMNDRFTWGFTTVKRAAVVPPYLLSCTVV